MSVARLKVASSKAPQPFTIESGVPIPMKGSCSPLAKRGIDWKAMKPGDSFFVPYDRPSDPKLDRYEMGRLVSYWSARATSRLGAGNYAVRQLPDRSGIRVWRKR